MPVYNAEKYIEQAIRSVMHQDYPIWELIIVDDGSNDSTPDLIHQFADPRIKYFKQENKGVSSARNLALTKTSGDFICFLDADDLMTKNSISSRLLIFDEHPELSIVGGSQEQKNETLSKSLKYQRPGFWGNPFRELLRLNPECFINCGTWMVRASVAAAGKFPEGITHGEDLVYFLLVSKNVEIGYTMEVAQIYRRHDSSAMVDLDGLEKGYKYYYRLAKNLPDSYSSDINYLKYKIIRIMVLSYLHNKDFLKAFRVFFELLRI